MSWLSLSRALDRSGTARYATDSIRRPDGTVLKGMKGLKVSGTGRPRVAGGMVAAGGPGMASSVNLNPGGWDSSSKALAQAQAEQAQKDRQALMLKYGEESMDLHAEEKAAKDAAKAAVTSRMNAEARRIGDMHENYAKRGLYAGDGAAAKGLTRKVKVSGDLGSLEELKQKNYVTEKKKLLTQKYANLLNPGRATAQLSRGLTTRAA